MPIEAGGSVPPEEKRKETSDRFNEINRTISEMSHSVNNFLAIISSRLELLEMGLIKKTGGCEKDSLLYIKQAKENIFLAAGILRTTLSKIRGEAINFEKYDICELVKKVIDLDDEILNMIRIQKNISSKKIFVVGHELSMRDALVNLLLNAQIAIKKDLIVTKGMTKQYFISVSVCEKGGFVEINIRDNGTGISEENQRKLFKESFTTNAQSGGTGLGLITVHKAVKIHDGEISVHSIEGNGTSFSIMIPIENTFEN